MENKILKKIDKIEKLLVEINSKIDNFMGFEELDEEELKEIDKIRSDIEKGEFKTLNEVFGD